MLKRFIKNTLYVVIATHLRSGKSMHKNSPFNLPISLIEASYKHLLNEHRLILFALLKYDANKKESITITAQEISDFFEMPLSQSYRFLESASKNILFKGFSVLNKLGNEVKEMAWLESINYKKGLAKVELKLSDDLINFLNHEKTKFISINNHYIFKLKTSYSIRIYEICSLLKETKQTQILLERLKTIFSLTSNYARFTNIKTRILEPSIKDINDNTDLNIKFDVVKEGTKIIGLIFNIKDKAKRPALNQRCEYTMDMFD